MNATDYQKRTSDTAIYPREMADFYLVAGLESEVGELCALYKRRIRDGAVTDFRDKLSAELGDVMWYIAQLCEVNGLDLSEVMRSNLAKLASRMERGVIKGEGDNR